MGKRKARSASTTSTPRKPSTASARTTITTAVKSTTRSSRSSSSSPSPIATPETSSPSMSDSSSSSSGCCSSPSPYPSRIPTSFSRLVYHYTRLIPRGSISTYKLVAAACGRPLASRAVGAALCHNPWAPHVPCHRVISSSGKIGGFMGKTGDETAEIKRKIRMLREEGIEFEKNEKGDWMGVLKKGEDYRKKVIVDVKKLGIPASRITPDQLVDEVLSRKAEA